MTPLNLDTLTQLAKAATPGLWRHASTEAAEYVHCSSLFPDGNTGDECMLMMFWPVHSPQKRREAEKLVADTATYIAAIDPAATLSLIAEARRFRFLRDWLAAGKMVYEPNPEISRDCWQLSYNYVICGYGATLEEAIDEAMKGGLNG